MAPSPSAGLSTHYKYIKKELGFKIIVHTGIIDNDMAKALKERWC